ncbi:uncharacterized protein [Drosophila suzukii]|uniref:Uncharacterized protein n=1 Tax=Drosophila suzukii TaxID=28584 RepID=A0AB40A1F9_DROSZ
MEPPPGPASFSTRPWPAMCPSACHVSDKITLQSVLVETQDKALRRISELREHCTLEQQAKAHLEEALGVEMDDMSCKMQAYQTKLQLLYENPENITAALERSGQLLDTEQLIDLESRRLLQMVLVPVKECPISSDYSKSRRCILRR